MGNTNPVNTTQRGYSGGEHLFRSTQETRQGSPEISALYRDYMTNRSADWSFAKRALQLAMTYFDPVKGFDFKKQDSNPLVKDYNYRFLIDTLRFIATGKREMDIVMWGSLMTDLPTPSDDIQDRHVLQDTVTTHNLDLRPQALVQRWCCQPNGLHDMVASLYLLFGERSVRRTDTGSTPQEPLSA